MPIIEDEGSYHDPEYTDPVCGVRIQRREPTASAQYKDQMYYFHSMECKAAFEREPERYAAKSARINAPAPGVSSS